MSVGIVIVTHGSIGQSMIDAAEFIVGQSLDDVRCVAYQQSGQARTHEAELEAVISDSDAGDGVLILTDLMGASPANKALQLMPSGKSVLVSGLNLAMLLRVCNYRERSLIDLADIAVEGARRGIGRKS